MSTSRPAILLVEDNEDDQLLTRAAFESAGLACALIPVSTAEDAIAYLSREGNYSDEQQFPRPAVVLIDLTLPGKSGHELLKWIQGRDELRGVVRIVLSGSQNNEDIEKSHRFGAHGYLVKPLTSEQLSQPGPTIQSLLLHHSTLSVPAR